MSKVRGRRSEKQKKEQEFRPAGIDSNEDVVKFADNDHASEFDGEKPTGSNGPNTFFGVLDTQELEYYKQAESTIAVDTFESPEEKAAFIGSVIDEAKSKELKLATSQICSKLMERMILECNDSQLKQLFQGFNGFFYNASCHKYASHVLETLLVKSAALVEKELLTPTFDVNTASTDGNDEVYATMENMFLFMLNEFKPHMKEMMKHQYASHVLRLVILILASKTLPSTTKANSTLRSKKSKIARKMIDIKDNDDFNKIYRTPDSFKLELREILQYLYKQFVKIENEPTVAEVTKFRELCVDKVASPVVQLIIQVEGIFDRDRKFWSLIFSNSQEVDPKEESFVEFLLSDPVGSHFLQNCLGFTKPKYAARLFDLYMKKRIVKLAQRDTTGAFVVHSCLQNLKSPQVKTILMDIVPELSTLINSNMDFGTAIIDASIKEEDFMKDDIIKQLVEKYYSDEDPNVLESCLLLSSSTLGNTKDDWPTAEERRRAIFLEKLIDYDDKFLNITLDSLLKISAEKLQQMCTHGVFSHVVEKVLQVKRVDIVKRRMLLNVLCTDVVSLACNAYGSHIVDKLWEFTAKLTLYKERVATALSKDSVKVKNSGYGKMVWKNWQMELYVRKHFDWKRLVRESDAEIFPDAKPLQPKRKFDKQEGNGKFNGANGYKRARK